MGRFPGGSVIKNLPAMEETQKNGFDLWIRKILCTRKHPLRIIAFTKALRN